MSPKHTFANSLPGSIVMARKVVFRQPSKRAIWLSFLAVALWAVLMQTGTRLPYLHTHFSFLLRAYILFPTLLAPLLYAAFVYRLPNQSIGYIELIKQQSTRVRRMKAAVFSLIGLVLIPGGLAWTSIAFPAWAAEVFARTPYVHVYYIEDIKVRSGPVWSTLFDLDLTSISTKPVTLRLNRSRYESNHWKTGEWICVLGRTSIFGTIIDDTSRYLGRCSK